MTPETFQRFRRYGYGVPTEVLIRVLIRINALPGVSSDPLTINAIDAILELELGNVQASEGNQAGRRDSGKVVRGKPVEDLPGI